MPGRGRSRRDASGNTSGNTSGPAKPGPAKPGPAGGASGDARYGNMAMQDKLGLARGGGIPVTEIPNALGQRFAKIVDGDRDGKVSKHELDRAAALRDPMAFRLIEKAYGSSAGKTGADLEKLLRSAGNAAAGAKVPGLSLPYDELFEGPRSEWVVAFGGDTHHAMSEKAPPDVSQFRGFKSYLEGLGFKSTGRQEGVDNTGFAVFTQVIKAPPDGHAHTLTVKVFNSSQYEGAGDEYSRTSQERRGYFSLSHAGEGLGLGIGGGYIRPEQVLDSEAPHMVMAAVACRSYDHYAGKAAKYLDQKKKPKEKLTFIGSTQELEMTQPGGAFAVLKSVFRSVFEQQNAPTLLQAANDNYNPIMSSYDPAFYEADQSRMVMDQDIRSTPILKALVGGTEVALPKAGAPV